MTIPTDLTTPEAVTEALGAARDDYGLTGEQADLAVREVLTCIGDNNSVSDSYDEIVALFHEFGSDRDACDFVDEIARILGYRTGKDT